MTQTVMNIVLFLLFVWFIAIRVIPPRGVRMITTAELKKELGKKDVQYVDVRTPAEFRANHIRGFLKIFPFMNCQNVPTNYPRKKK
ncbi:hypothetical protein PG301_16400 [Parageobacillus sp. G301]|nr:hypothetical protein PG301_16400 [Parageobacillus sp. G301]